MRKGAFCALLLLLLAPLAAAKDKPQLPKMVVEAKYVFVTTYAGDPFDNPRAVTNEDRQAVFEVESAIRKWGRYAITTRQQDADLILVVRRGRIASVSPGIHIGTGSDRSTTMQPNVTGDAGDPLDMLAVYDAFHGTDTAPLWRGRQRDGLTPPEMRLVKEFREKVEAAAKTP